MDWIPILLKQLDISRAFIAAIFLTSLVLYLGPRFVPDYVEAVPPGWSLIVIGALVFSGSLLLWWSLVSGSVLSGRICKSIVTFIKAWSLSEEEIDVLLAMSVNPDEPLNLERINYQEINVSKLEIMQMMRTLEGKGLVSLNPYRQTLISLTPNGQKRALKLYRERTN